MPEKHRKPVCAAQDSRSVPWRKFPFPPVIRTVGLSFAVHTVILLFSLLLSLHLPANAPAGFVNPALSTVPVPFDRLIRWDAHWYTYLAEYGYSAQTIVFFPVTPLLIRTASSWGLGNAAAGLFVCNLFVLFSMFALYAVFRLDCSDGECKRALLAYAVMPTSFFLNSIYTEPFFITFAALCVWLARREQWIPAGLFAALAALTRNLGIFLVLFLVWEYGRVHGWRHIRFSFAAGTVLAPLATSAFMVFNYRLLGDPLAFAHLQTAWGRQFGWPWSNIWNSILLSFSDAAYGKTGIVLDSVLVLAVLGILLLETFSPKYQIRSSYLVLAWSWFLVPLCSTSPLLPLYSMARFVLVVFPVYLFFTRIRRPVFYAFLLISAAALTVYGALFCNWVWIG